MDECSSMESRWILGAVCCCYSVGGTLGANVFSSFFLELEINGVEMRWYILRKMFGSY